MNMHKSIQKKLFNHFDFNEKVIVLLVFIL